MRRIIFLRPPPPTLRSAAGHLACPGALPTLDADICPAADPGNLQRLAAALEDLDARIRIRRFHDAVLGQGSVPLPILERILNAFIEDEPRNEQGQGRRVCVATMACPTPHDPRT